VAIWLPNLADYEPKHNAAFSLRRTETIYRVNTEYRQLDLAHGKRQFER
jgi:hypothetical protein